MMRSLLLLTVAACATGDDDGDEYVDELGSARVAWTRDGSCHALLADDGVDLVLHCRRPQHTLEVIDAASGTTRWQVSLPPALDASAFTHADRVWLWIADPVAGNTRRRAYVLATGAVESDVAASEIPASVTWDASGTRYEVGVGGSGLSPTMQNWTRVRTYDASGAQRWGTTVFAQSGWGMTAAFPSSNGNVYIAAREYFEAHSSTGTLLWSTRPGTMDEVFFTHDGRPVAMFNGGTIYYPSDAPIDAWGNITRIGLSFDRVTRETTVQGQSAFALTTPTTMVLRNKLGALLSTLVASTATGLDGLSGPEFGLLPMTGVAGALIQVPTGIGYVPYGSTTPSWTRARFFLPVATGTGGFIGLCTRPPPRTPTGPAQVADVATFCSLSESATAGWRATVPWANYGVTARQSAGQRSRWQGETGTFIDAPVAKRWIVNSILGTSAIRTD